MYPLPGTTEIPKQSIQTTEQSNVGDRASKGPDKPGMISMVDTLPDYFKAVKAKGGPNATNSDIGGEIRSYAYHLSIDYIWVRILEHILILIWILYYNYAKNNQNVLKFPKTT